LKLVQCCSVRQVFQQGEALSADAGVDAYVQAAGAEILRREGHEVQVLTALHTCKRLQDKN